MSALRRALSRLIPRRLLRRLDDRFFGAIFQVTRVTNDNYGWRPPTDGRGGPVQEGEHDRVR